ncbi:hypothetical protein P4H66_02965 [Paenibacillus dokdonensis]|uniref:Uncharacterized protein n=2 Tax=Paenibacillus dokdonensis TaxID=2567944 RepID=A0ABU6GGG0_9BACL|nr:hypothetical protein [Paenibacillus dokdonensis]MEC0238831.1 hypothetical protein [Paenibacillus dokdonensis]
MMPAVRDISFERLEEALPAFFIIAFIPLMHSIVDGIAISFISYALFHIALGKWREVKPLFYIVSHLFVIYFILQTLTKTYQGSPLRTHQRSGGLFGTPIKSM